MREDKRRPEVQAPMIVRMVRAHGRRVGAADPDALPGLLAIGEAWRKAQEDAVAGLLAQGFSLAEIGSAVGITKQAVHIRWGHVRARATNTHTRTVPVPKCVDNGSGVE